MAMLLVIVLVAACGGGAADEPATTTGGDANGGAATTQDTTAGTGDADDGDGAAGNGVVLTQHPALDVLDELMTMFPNYINNPGTILQRGDEGNILRALIASDSTFPGIFEYTQQHEAFDAQITDLTMWPLVSLNADFTFGQTGIATIEFAADLYSITLTMRDYDFAWHDGTPFTLDDLVFSYEVIAHPDYTGVRYIPGSFAPLIEGIEEFRDGTRDYISGLVLSNNNRTLTINYTQPLPPSAMYGGGIWLAPSPRHWIEPAIAEVGVADLSGHARIRHEAIGMGPWIIDTIVPGESVLFRANDDFPLGAPNIDYLLWEIVPNALAMAALREGLYDYTINPLPATFFEEHLLFNADNYRIASTIGNGLGFIYFRVGTVESDDEGPLIMPREEWHPIMELPIRRALAHSIDFALKAATIQNGLSVPAGTVMTPFNAREFIQADVPGFFFDMALANQILDEAGYTERGPDGFRLDLDGNPMYFNAAFNDNTFNQQAVPTFLQNWREIGLDVRLFQDDLIEWTVFVDNLLNSDNWTPDVHIHLSNWSMGANPSPTGLWGRRVPFNMARHYTPEFQGILDDIISPQAWDSDFMADAYSRWQWYMYNNAVAAPTFWSIQTFYVNNRVTGVDLESRDGNASVAMQSLNWGLVAPVAEVFGG